MLSFSNIWFLSCQLCYLRTPTAVRLGCCYITVRRKRLTFQTKIGKCALAGTFVIKVSVLWNSNQSYLCYPWIFFIENKEHNAGMCSHLVAGIVLRTKEPLENIRSISGALLGQVKLNILSKNYGHIQVTLQDTGTHWKGWCGSNKERTASRAGGCAHMLDKKW